DDHVCHHRPIVAGSLLSCRVVHRNTKLSWSPSWIADDIFKSRLEYAHVISLDVNLEKWSGLLLNLDGYRRGNSHVRVASCSVRWAYGLHSIGVAEIRAKQSPEDVAAHAVCVDMSRVLP